MKYNRIRSSNSGSYYSVDYGGTWNSGTRKFTSYRDMVRFIEEHLFDGTPVVTKVEYVDVDISKYVTKAERSELTKEGSDEVFNKGITNIANLKK